MKSEGITDVFKVHPDMKVCTKFLSNPSNSFRDISLKTTNVNLIVALEEMSEDPKSLGFVLWGPWMPV